VCRSSALPYSYTAIARPGGLDETFAVSPEYPANSAGSVGSAVRAEPNGDPNAFGSSVVTASQPRNAYQIARMYQVLRWLRSASQKMTAG
jgi:hypothetical protein